MVDASPAAGTRRVWCMAGSGSPTEAGTRAGSGAVGGGGEARGPAPSRGRRGRAGPVPSGESGTRGVRRRRGGGGDARVRCRRWRGGDARVRRRRGVGEGKGSRRLVRWPWGRRGGIAYRNSKYTIITFYTTNFRLTSIPNMELWGFS
jgi:hypothetical protein